MQADAVSADPELRRKAQTALRFLGSWTLRNEIGNPPIPSGSGGVRAVGEIGVPGASSSRGTSISGLYEFDDEHQRTEVSPVAWRVAAHRAGSDVGELTEPELRQRRREAMVLQHDGVGVSSEDDTDYIPPPDGAIVARRLGCLGGGFWVVVRERDVSERREESQRSCTLLPFLGARVIIRIITSIHTYHVVEHTVFPQARHLTKAPSSSSP